MAATLSAQPAWFGSATKWDVAIDDVVIGIIVSPQFGTYQAFTYHGRQIGDGFDRIAQAINALEIVCGGMAL